MAADIFDKRTRFFPVQNVDSVPAPPYALLFCDADAGGWRANGNRIYLPVQRTTPTGAGEAWCPGMHIWLANSPIAIPPGGFGVATCNWPYKMLLDPSATPGAILAAAVTDGDPVLGPVANSWGVAGNPAIRLFNMVSQDPWDDTLIWVVEYREIKPPPFFNEPLDSSISGESGELGTANVPADGLYFVQFQGSVSVSPAGTLVSVEIESDDTKYPDQPMGDMLSGVAGQDQWQLSMDTYHDDTLTLQTPGTLPLNFGGLMNLAAGDTVTVNWSASQSCTGSITGGVVWGYVVSAPFFAVVGQGA